MRVKHYSQFNKKKLISYPLGFENQCLNIARELICKMISTPEEFEQSFRTVNPLMDQFSMWDFSKDWDFHKKVVRFNRNQIHFTQRPILIVQTIFQGTSIAKKISTEKKDNDDSPFKASLVFVSNKNREGHVHVTTPDHWYSINELNGTCIKRSVSRLNLDNLSSHFEVHEIKIYLNQVR